VAGGGGSGLRASGGSGRLNTGSSSKLNTLGSAGSSSGKMRVSVADDGATTMQTRLHTKLPSVPVERMIP